jgi:hypothetical protein
VVGDANYSLLFLTLNIWKTIMAKKAKKMKKAKKAAPAAK